MKAEVELKALGGLLWREARFVQEYIANGGNTTAALASAGYRPTGRNPFHNPRIRDALRAEFAKYAAEKGVDARRVIGEMAVLGFAPLGDPHVKPAEKLKALELLGRHLGLFDENINLNLRATQRQEVVVSLRDLTTDELLLLEQLGRRTRQPATAPTNGSGPHSASSNGTTSRS